MTYKQLGGACEKTFSAITFEEIADLSKAHGMEMYEAGDEKKILLLETKEIDGA